MNDLIALTSTTGPIVFFGLVLLAMIAMAKSKKGSSSDE